VLEIDPATKAIVWKHQEPRLADFFSPRLSNAQRLPNGNTLINEGWSADFFEATPAGEVVWEYVNPYFGVRQNFPSMRCSEPTATAPRTSRKRRRPEHAGDSEPDSSALTGMRSASELAGLGSQAALDFMPTAVRRSAMRVQQTGWLDQEN
jgi:hypothetical protein